MKRVLSLSLAVVMFFTLCACGGDNQKNTTKDKDVYTVTLSDGTSEEMTHEDLESLGENSLKLEKYIGATVSGSGKIESIDRDSQNPQFAKVKVNFMDFEINNVPVEVASNYDVDETIDFEGTLTHIFGCIVYLNYK